MVKLLCFYFAGTFKQAKKKGSAYSPLRIAIPRVNASTKIEEEMESEIIHMKTVTLTLVSSRMI